MPGLKIFWCLEKPPMEASTTRATKDTQIVPATRAGVSTRHEGLDLSSFRKDGAEDVYNGSAREGLLKEILLGDREFATCPVGAGVAVHLERPAACTTW